MTLTEMFAQYPDVAETPNTLGSVLASYHPNHVPADPELSARLTAIAVKQVLKAHRREVLKARLATVWWAPLRTARIALRLFTD